MENLLPIVILISSVIIVILMAVYLSLKAEETALRANPSPYVLKDQNWYCLDLDTTDSTNYCKPFAHPQPLVSKKQPNLLTTPPQNISNYCYNSPITSISQECGGCLNQGVDDPKYDFIKCALFKDDTSTCGTPELPTPSPYNCTGIANAQKLAACNNFDILNKGYVLGIVDAQKSCNNNTFVDSIANLTTDPRWLSDNTSNTSAPIFTCEEKIGFEAMFCQFQASYLTTDSTVTRTDGGTNDLRSFTDDDICCIDFISDTHSLTVTK